MTRGDATRTVKLHCQLSVFEDWAIWTVFSQRGSRAEDGNCILSACVRGHSDVPRGAIRRGVNDSILTQHSGATLDLACRPLLSGRL